MQWNDKFKFRIVITSDVGRREAAIRATGGALKYS